MGEALTQISKGWLEGPFEIYTNGSVEGSEGDRFNAAFMFGVEQMN